MRTYLDWNATTPPLEEVLDAMRDAARSAWGNPSSIHADGRAARAVVETAREAVAELAGADARDVLFTGGGTEANNIAVRSAVETKAGAAAGVGEGAPWIVTSRLEHPSITRVAEALEAEDRARVRWLRVDESGVVDLADLERATDKSSGHVALVAVQAVNHETGVIQPITDVIRISHAVGARVHIDAVQGWGKIDTSMVAGADSCSFAAHKFRGPKGIGALVTRPNLRLTPVLLGGTQERGLRPGTVDPVLASGFAVACHHALEGPARYAAVGRRRDTLEAALLKSISGERSPSVAGDPSKRAPHVSLMVWPGWVGAELVAALDLEGVSVSSGAACSAGTIEPSPVLFAMANEHATAGVRRARLPRRMHHRRGHHASHRSLPPSRDASLVGRILPPRSPRRQGRQARASPLRSLTVPASRRAKPAAGLAR
jgi:cysteine desulfurase